MRAIGVAEYGGPEALGEIEVAPETLRPGAVRVRVTAATVNPTDTGVRTGKRRTGDRPAGAGDVPGMEIAGVVREVGADTDTDLTEGDRVIGIVVPTGEHGAYRDELVLPVRSVVRAPRSASDAEAATIPMNGLTARHALDLLGLRRGQVLAVTGAAGALGGYVVQLAVDDGLTVVADASEADQELVRSLGAHAVVRRGDDVAERIRERYPDGVDGLVDAAVQNERVLPAVKDGGAVATVRYYEGDGQRGVRVYPVQVRDVAEDRGLLEQVRDKAEQGVLTLRVAEVLPAAAAPEAHRRLEAGGLRGRLVLDFTA